MATQVPTESMRPSSASKEVTSVIMLFDDGTYEMLDVASVLAVAWTHKRITEKPGLENPPKATWPTCKWIDPPGYWDCLVPGGKPMK